MAFDKDLFDNEVAKVLPHSGSEDAGPWEDLLHVHRRCQAVARYIPWEYTGESRSSHTSEFSRSRRLAQNGDVDTLEFDEYFFIVAHYLLLCCSLLLLVVLGIRVAWIAVRSQHCLTSIVKRFLGAVVRLRWTRASRSRETALSDAKVRAKVNDTLIQRCIVGAQIALPMATLLLCLHIPLLLPSDLTEWNSASHARKAKVIVSQSHIPLMLTCVCTAMIAALFPSFVTPRFVDTLDVLISLLILASMVSHHTYEWFLFNNSWTILLRCIMAVIHGKPIFAITLNAIHAIVVLVAIHHGVFRDRNSHFDSDVMSQVFGFFTISLLSHLSQQSREIEARASKETEQSRTVETAVDKLLSSMCDAVVHTNDALDLTRPCPKFGSLLLRSSQPANFLDTLWHDSDKEAVRTYIAKDACHAHSLHVSLRDASPSAVRVQLLHVGYKGLDDRNHHIIGIREEAEIEGAVQSRMLQQEAQPSPLLDAPIGRSSDDDTETSGQSSSCSSFHPIALVSDVLGPTVWVNVCDRELHIEKCTAEFTSLIGPSSKGLLHSIERQVREPFIGWLQDLAQDLAQQGVESRVEFAYQVGLRARVACQKRHYKVIAECFDECRWDDNLVIVRLFFRETKSANAPHVMNL